MVAASVQKGEDMSENGKKFEKRDNSGVLFKSTNKTKETSPDYYGFARINGVDMKLAAWIKESDKGRFMSLNFSLADEARQGSKPATAQPATRPEAKPAPTADPGDDDDRLPF